MQSCAAQFQHIQGVEMQSVVQTGSFTLVWSSLGELANDKVLYTNYWSLCSHNQPSGGLTWHGSKHSVVRIYSGKERGENIMDVGSFFHLPSPSPIYRSLLFTLTSQRPIVQEEETVILLMCFFVVVPEGWSPETATPWPCLKSLAST